MTRELVRLAGAEIKESHCFGCSPRNLHGLKLSMWRIEEGLGSDFTLSEDFESYPGIIHGGIISTILDEVMGNVPVVLDGLLCFTVSLRLRFLTPLRTREPYRCLARIAERPTASTDAFKVDGTIHPARSDEVLAAASGFYRPFSKVELPSSPLTTHSTD